MITKTKIIVRYSETDRMGIVHHSRYYPWFEIARSEFVKLAGMSYSKMEDAGVLMPLVETGAKYLGVCTFEDEVEVTACLKSLSAAKCEFYYEVYKDGKIITKGKTIHGFVDKNFRPLNLKKKNPEIYSFLEELIEE